MKNQIQKSGRFRDHHFCLYFGPGLHWDQAGSQAQNTSKNDDMENGPNFDHQESIMKVERKSLQYVINYLQFL